MLLLFYCYYYSLSVTFCKKFSKLTQLHDHSLGQNNTTITQNGIYLQQKIYNLKVNKTSLDIINLIVHVIDLFGLHICIDALTHIFWTVISVRCTYSLHVILYTFAYSLVNMLLIPEQILFHFKNIIYLRYFFHFYCKCFYYIFCICSLTWAVLGNICILLIVMHHNTQANPLNVQTYLVINSILIWTHHLQCWKPNF